MRRADRRGEARWGWTGLFRVVFALLVIGLAVPAIAAADEHFTAGPPTAEEPLTTATGVAAEAWADPICPPGEGTQDKDPGVAPSSWAQFLGETVLGGEEELEVEELVGKVVEEALADYLKHSEGSYPPGVTSVKDAVAKVKANAMAALLSQEAWEGVIQHFGNVYKPSPADGNEFLAHVDEYPTGVSSAACDGNDGYRLFESRASGSLFQLSSEGSWAKLTYDTGAPEPPEGAIWMTVPGTKVSTYVATVPAANPLDPYGIPMARVVGELTMGPGVDVHSCGTDESTTETVGNQLDSDVYDAVRYYANWLSSVPQASFLALLPSVDEDCATTPAVYTEWSEGPLVARNTFAISERATYIAGYTATSSLGAIDRWKREGDEWEAGEAFGRPTFNQGFEEVVPRLAISGDGSTIAGCWLSGPTAGSGFESISIYDTVHYPEVFHFDDGTVAYPEAVPPIHRRAATSALTEKAKTCGTRRAVPGRAGTRRRPARSYRRPVRERDTSTACTVVVCGECDMESALF